MLNHVRVYPKGRETGDLRESYIVYGCNRDSDGYVESGSVTKKKFSTKEDAEVFAKKLRSSSLKESEVTQ